MQRWSLSQQIWGLWSRHWLINVWIQPISGRLIILYHFRPWQKQQKKKRNSSLTQASVQSENPYLDFAWNIFACIYARSCSSVYVLFPLFIVVSGVELTVFHAFLTSDLLCYLLDFLLLGNICSVVMGLVVHTARNNSHRKIIWGAREYSLRWIKRNGSNWNIGKQRQFWSILKKDYK